jgi:hypothetical protein
MKMIPPVRHFGPKNNLYQCVILVDHLLQLVSLLPLERPLPPGLLAVLLAALILGGGLLSLRPAAEILAHQAALDPPRAGVVASFSVARFPGHGFLNVRDETGRGAACPHRRRHVAADSVDGDRRELIVINKWTKSLGEFVHQCDKRRK